tara:strand:- start:3079 stop:5205 length:2127 start_codon:yes stop_codon:yes gene_type:complete
MRFISFRLFYTFVLLSFISLSSSPLASIYELPSHAIKINDTSIILNSPLIAKETTTYVPMRDLLSVLDGFLSYNRKQSTYKLKSQKQNISCLIIPYSNEFWIKNKPHHFRYQPIIWGSRLYVPVNEFFTMLGYSVSFNRKSKSWLILNDATIDGEASLPEKKQTPIVKSKITPNDIHVPLSTTQKDLTLSIGKNLYRFKDNLIIKDGIIYAKIINVFKQEGYDVNLKENQVIFKKHKRHFYFNINSRKAQSIISNKMTPHYLQNIVIETDDGIYFPLISSLSFVGFSATWKDQDRSLLLLSNIEDVSVRSITNGVTIDILSSSQIKATDIFHNQKKQKVTFSVPYSKKQTSSFISNPYNKLFNNIKITKGPDQNTLFEIDLKTNDHPALITDTAYGLSISFKSNISSVKQTVITPTQEKAFIGIKGPFKYKSFKSKDSKHIIIDIPNSIFSIPQVSRSSINSIYQIRAMQNKTKTGTRIMIGLNNTSTQFTTKQSQGGIAITLTSKNTFLSEKKIAHKRGILANKVIVIDPGHGGRDPGSIGPRKNFEKKYTMDISYRLESLLKKEGATVILCRKGDVNPSLKRRTYIANKNKADAFLSIHINSFYNQRAKGTETYYYKTIDKPLARSIHAELNKSLGFKNLGLKRSRMYVLTNSTVPAALLEPLFITNPAEFKKLQSPVFRQKMSISIKDGLINYFESQNKLRKVAR